MIKVTEEMLDAGFAAYLSHPDGTPFSTWAEHMFIDTYAATRRQIMTDYTLTDHGSTATLHPHNQLAHQRLRELVGEGRADHASLSSYGELIMPKPIVGSIVDRLCSSGMSIKMGA